MRFWCSFILAAALAGAPALADGKVDPVKRDWPRLTGTWVSPYRKSAESGSLQRYLITFARSGEDRSFVQKLETRASNGTEQSVFIHSAVLVVTKLRVEGKKRFIVIQPKVTPMSAGERYAMQIQYEFVKKKLRLKGSIGTASLNGDWSPVLPSRP